MVRAVIVTTRGLVVALGLTLAGPVAASRVAYEQTGQITAITPDGRDIKIDGKSYQLAKKVAIHSTEKGSAPLDADSLPTGSNIGYTVNKTDQGKPEVTSIWVLPAQ